MRELKVWGTSHYYKGCQQMRAIVATRTKKKAAELLGQSMHIFNEYAAQTQNEMDLKLALAKPETVIVRERY